MAIPAEARLFAVVPAGGTGTRMGGPLPKQYLTVQGRTLAEHTLTRLLAYARIEKVVVATAKDDLWWPQLAVAHHGKVVSAVGGRSRAASVLACLDVLAEHGDDSDWVLVHDMARPCVRLSDIDQLVQRCGKDGALLARPLTDTIKQASGDHVSKTLERDNLWRALTPQLFPLGALRDAIRAGLDKGIAMTGQADNIKLTVPADLALVRFYLSQQDDEGLAWESA